MTVLAGKTPLKVYSPGSNMAPEGLDFEFIEANHIVVEDSLGQKLVDGAHYEISGDSRLASATIRALVEVDAEIEWTVYSMTPVEQRLDLAESRKLPLKTYETELDRMAIRQREQARELDRGVQVPRREGGLLLPRLADRAGKLLGFDQDGNFSLVTLDDAIALAIAGVQAALQALVDTAQSWSSSAQLWAEGSEPGGAGTKSSKGWAEYAENIFDQTNPVSTADYNGGAYYDDNDGSYLNLGAYYG